ncbi:MAG: AhpC/TSA family protein [Clostridiales bacterium]|nr:AhpC/TSA family protein [Clostridiales bacterium]
MKIQLLAAGLIAATVATSCSGNKQGDAYTLNVVMDNDTNNGSTLFLKNYDNGSVIDSVVIADSKATFTGNITEPTVVTLSIDGNRGPVFILEEGTTEYKDGKAISNLNDQYQAFFDDYVQRRDSLYKMINENMDEAEQIAVHNLIQMHLDSVVSEKMVANISNPIGYMLLLQKAFDMESDKFEALLTKYPHLAKFDRISRIKKSFDAKKATSAGNAYTDFEVTGDSVAVKLSDCIVPGQYNLVDFWASWCGPCKREIGIMKQLYEKYNSKGLNIVGVDVWENSSDAKAWLAENPLPWKVIFAGKDSSVTDLYGINGIPCIMLIDPQGKIVARDLFEDELVSAVDNAMNGTVE